MEKAYHYLLTINNENTFYLYIVALVTCGEKLKNIIAFLNKNKIKFSFSKYATYYRRYFTRMIFLSVKNEYKDVLPYYNSILNIYSKLAKKIGITKPLEFGLFFEYLLFNGYFSIDKQFKYSKINKKYGPYSVASGTGVCGNMSVLLIDFLTKCGVESMLLINYFNVSDKNIIPFIIGNHAAVLIKEDKSYLYDITNKTLAYKTSHNKYKSINDKYVYLDRNMDGVDPIMYDNKESLIKYRNECKKKVDVVINKNKKLIDEVYNCIIYDIMVIDDYIKERESLEIKEKVRRNNV